MRIQAESGIPKCANFGFVTNPHEIYLRHILEHSTVLKLKSVPHHNNSYVFPTIPLFSSMIAYPQD